jgi:hypothetical protein
MDPPKGDYLDGMERDVARDIVFLVPSPEGVSQTWLDTQLGQDDVCSGSAWPF